MKRKLKKLLRDVPTSLLVIVGIMLLLFSVSNIVSLVTAIKREANLLKESDYNVSYSMYVYEGKIEESEDVVACSPIENPEKLVDSLKVSKGNVTMQLRLPIDGAYYGDDGGNKIDLVLYQNEELHTQGEVFKPSKKENAVLISEDLSYLVNGSGTIEFVGARLNVLSKLKSVNVSGNDSRCFLLYYTFNDSMKERTLTQIRQSGRVLVTISSNKSRLTDEIKQVKKALTDNGFTVRTTEIINMDIVNDAYKTMSMMIAVLVIFFAFITIMIMMNLWIYARQKNYAILWSLGRKRMSTLKSILKEAGILYLIAVILYCITETVVKLTVSTKTIDIKDIVINDILYVVITYVVLNAVILAQYLKIVKKADMCRLLTGGVQ